LYSFGSYKLIVPEKNVSDRVVYCCRRDSDHIINSQKLLKLPAIHIVCADFMFVVSAGGWLWLMK